MKYSVAIGLVLLLGAPPMCGQEVTNPDASSDTVQSATKRNTFREIFRGNPGRAALYSLILPGAGQVYNKKYLKLPLVLGLEGGAGFWLWYNRKEYKYYDGIFDDLVAGEVNNAEGFTLPSQVKPWRDKFRKQTEYAWVFMVLAHLYNVFDAYVDRHLLEFDISEDLSLQYRNEALPYPTQGMAIVYRF